MTRKIIAATLSLLVGVVLLASPAEAAHRGLRIYEHSWNGVTVHVKIIVNQSDVQIGKFEGLADAYEFTNPDVGADPDIRYDWIHLRKDGVLVAQTSSASGWMDLNTSYSTPWYDSLCQNDPRFQTTARYQIRYNHGAGNLSPWYTNKSYDWLCN